MVPYYGIKYHVHHIHMSYSTIYIYMIYAIWYHIMVLNITDFERRVYLRLLLVTPTDNGFLPWQVLALFCC